MPRFIVFALCGVFVLSACEPVEPVGTSSRGAFDPLELPDFDGDL